MAAASRSRAALTPSAPIEVLADSGHVPLPDHPGKCPDLTIQFLEAADLDHQPARA